MLANSDVIAFVATANAPEARKFYQDILQLDLIEDSPVALIFDANGIMLRVTRVQTVAVAPYAILGWNVSDIVTNVRDLASRGVHFEHYPNLIQDADNIWTSPSGVRVAWFKDPDGNTLSLAQEPS